MADDYGSIPTHGGGATQCPDCWHPAHRNMTRPKGNKPCPICGCPDLIEAKRERDGDRSGDHFAGSNRNDGAGFSPAGGDGRGASIG